MGDEKKCLIIIDSNSLIHRAFHALPHLTTKKGELVNAVYGFLLVFFKAIKDFQPDFITACFDFPAPTFRHEKYKEYKAKRPPTPKELSEQISKIKEVLNVFNVPIFEKEGFEADDLIATLSNRIPEDIETYILSGDLDTLQLVNQRTKVCALGRGVKETVIYDEEKIRERFNLNPAQMVDFKALRGDPSDNIPGVKGVGEKTASQLISQFGSLENLYKYIENPRQSASKEKICVNPRVQVLLEQNKEQAFFSKSLVQLNQNVPIDFNLEKSQWGNYDKGKVIKVLRSLEFHSLVERLPGFETQKESDKIKESKSAEQKTLWNSL